MTKPGDVDHYTRVRCYEHVLKRYPEQTTALSLLLRALSTTVREAGLAGILGAFLCAAIGLLAP